MTERAVDVTQHLLHGQVIPAHPLALTVDRTLDERYQRALTRYYMAAGAGGVAVAVHTTQFAIREPQHGLLEPVLALAAETVDAELAARPRDFIKIAGLVGATAQALREAALARSLGYDAGLLSLGALRDAGDAALLEHCRAVGESIPLFGFYLQPAVGGRSLGYAFWRAFAELPSVVAIKIAPFSRYGTLDVVRAIADSGRRDIALYTGNDDHIVLDLLTRFPRMGETNIEPRIVGGLLGHWAFWTRRAVTLLEEIRVARDEPRLASPWLTRAAAVTDANAAIFDAAHCYAGCIPGIHEILWRQGLLRGTWCLDPHERLSPGQREAIDRVVHLYPEMSDDAFVEEGLDEWLR